MLKRVVVLVITFVVLFGTSISNAENWVNTDDLGELVTIDTDSIQYLTIGTDSVIRCKTKVILASELQYYMITVLINTDNQTYCNQLFIAYSLLNDKEIGRSVRDPQVLKNWEIYHDNDHNAGNILRTIKHLRAN